MDFNVGKKEIEKLKEKLYGVGARIIGDDAATALGQELGVVADKVRTRAAVSTCIITRRIDAYALYYLNENPYGTIINLSEGISTRFGRVDNGKCSFVEVTSKEIRALKNAKLGHNERHSYIVSTADNLRWINGAPDCKYPLVIMEGVLDRFTKQDVLVLLKRLREKYDDALFVFDHYSESSMRYSRAKWGMDNPADICSYVVGLRCEDSAHIGTEECIEYLSGAEKLWFKLTDSLEMSKYAKSLSMYRFFNPISDQEL